MRSYKEHFIAFMDILGFKELITYKECEAIYQIFSDIHLRTKASMNYNGVQIKAYEHIHHRILSDSVIVFIDAEIEDSFPALLDVCKMLQLSLADRDEPILLRGGIAKGELYYEEELIYGRGLTTAYLLESNLAQYPRVIFTGSTLDAGKLSSKYMFPEFDGLSRNYKQDEDALYFVDYLPSMNNGWDLDKIKQYSDRVLALCDKMLNTIVDANLRKKYLWLKSHVKESIHHMAQIEELYRKEAEAKFELECNEYNARFSIYKENENM